MKHKPHWYRVTVFYCPACGGETKYKERMYSPRPDKWEERNEWIDAWDYCDAL